MKRKDLKKKLVLSRETLAELDTFDLKQAGGATAVEICGSGVRTCATCGPTCTSRLC